MSLLRPQCPSNKNVSEAPSWPAVTNLSIAEADLYGQSLARSRRTIQCPRTLQQMNLRTKDLNFNLFFINSLKHYMLDIQDMGRVEQ